jgi:hypothetical protein
MIIKEVVSALANNRSLYLFLEDINVVLAQQSWTLAITNRENKYINIAFDNINKLINVLVNLFNINANDNEVLESDALANLTNFFYQNSEEIYSEELDNNLENFVENIKDQKNFFLIAKFKTNHRNTNQIFNSIIKASNAYDILRKYILFEDIRLHENFPLYFDQKEEIINNYIESYINYNNAVRDTINIEPNLHLDLRESERRLENYFNKLNKIHSSRYWVLPAQAMAIALRNQTPLPPHCIACWRVAGYWLQKIL